MEVYINLKEIFMKNTIKLFGIIALVAIIGFTVVSCGGGGSPTAAAKAFMAAVEKGDAKAMEKVATKDTVALMTMFGEKASSSVKEYGKITNTSEKIDGDNATVSLTFESGKTEELTLIKENGKWLVNVSK
jgi:predicted negative regulator of RcsB-dependent stress response